MVYLSLLLAVFNTLFFFLFFLRENGQSTKILEVRQNGRRRLLRAQSINTERALSSPQLGTVESFRAHFCMNPETRSRYFETARNVPKAPEVIRIGSGRVEGSRHSE